MNTTQDSERTNADPRSRSAPSNVIASAETSFTPESIELVQLEQEHIDKILRIASGGARNVQDIYPLAPLQEGMLFHHLLNQRSDTFLLSTLFELESRNRIDELIDAIQKVIQRHDALRTSVVWEGLPTAMQVVHRDVSLPVEELAVGDNCDVLEQLESRMRPRLRNIDLTRAPLVRLCVAAAKDGARWYGLLQIHHVICDFQSLKVAVAEIMSCLEGRANELPTPIPYRNHIAKVTAQLQPPEVEEFFRAKFGDVTEPTAPFALFDVHGDGSQIAEAREAVERALALDVRLRAKHLGVSPARLVHVAWSLVVAHTSGRGDVVFGTLLAARQHRAAPDGQGLGVYVNTLPLRLRLAGVTVSELVLQTHRELLDVRSHESVPLSTVQRCSGIAGAAPLFTALINYRRSTSNIEDAPAARGVRVRAWHGVWTNYPIVVSVDDMGEDFTLTAQTDLRIDPHRLIGYMLTALRSMTKALRYAPQTPALALSILPDKERREVVQYFNATAVPFRKDKLVHEMFEDQVVRAPRMVALICGDQQLTYIELNIRANQVAHALMARGVRPEVRVALYVERSARMVIGLLGILKAGGAYVPMDISYPAQRIQHMLTDSAPLIVVTQERFKHTFATAGVQVLTLDGDGVSREADQNPSAANLGLRPENAVYVIYTSGSTGVPKGVTIEHRNLLNLVHWHSAAFDVKEGRRCSGVAAAGFDAAGWEIWPPLSMGATLVLASHEASSDAEKLMAWWAGEFLHVSFLPTPMAEFAFSRNIHNARLRTLLVGGDRLRHRPASGSFALVNNYGPTESTVVATSGQIDCDDPVLHIGRPIANTQIYILDERREPVPIGVAGEIYIGGAGVARGYRNRPDLTAQRFVADPFSDDGEARLYRTGDLGRWRANGTIEYLGRNDHQVKIRGYRIELGEIEAQLIRHALIKDVVVIAREDVPGEMTLVAYFTQHMGSDGRIEELREFVKAVLPEYMVPAAFVLLERFPMTPNGKLDRNALPAPDLGAYASGQYEAPQGDVEEVLARLWQDLLQIKQVGRQGNFFELGGHSLLAITLVFRVNQAFGRALRVTDVYRHPKLRDLAARVGGSVPDDDFVDLSREAILDQSIVPAPGSRRVPAQDVLLTGGTGFVGRFLLAQLLEATEAQVYCLVRAKTQRQAMSRLKTTLLKWDLWRDDFEGRIIALPGDLGRPRLGIDEETYRLLSKTLDSIYHCATSMNHLETFEMAKPENVDAARELLKLATHHKPMLVNYISTLSVFCPTGSTSRVVDEMTPIDEERHLASRGYITSKWVAEKIFMTASERNIPCNIFRVGLVWADTQLGRYDELQQGYRIFKSCLLSGCAIEDFSYQMNPTPVDYVARSVVFLANQNPDGRGIFHVSSSNQMSEGMFERCNKIAGTSLELMSHYDWIQEMKKLHNMGRSIPAMPLIDFAFSLDEKSFNEHQRGTRAARIQFDCSRTHRVLESAGIFAPTLSDDLLKLYVTSMFSRDRELRELSDCGERPSYAPRDARIEFRRSGAPT